ncbi:hypothetical protein GCM10010199_70230 [Dactylosporangium roseum]
MKWICPWYPTPGDRIQNAAELRTSAAEINGNPVGLLTYELGAPGSEIGMAGTGASADGCRSSLPIRQVRGTTSSTDSVPATRCTATTATRGSGA